MNATSMRPQHLDEMIGQNDVKAKASIAIQAALQRGEPLPHCLLTSPGTGGLGKTSFAGVLANEMFSQLVSTTGQCLVTATDLRNILVRLEPSSVLLIDEFHGIGRSAAEELLLVLEEGVLNVNIGGNSAPIRIAVPSFTLCAATTNPEAVSSPLMQRFGLSFRFDFYSNAEIAQIAKGVFAKWGMQIDVAASDNLARRARGVPRLVLRLAERVRDVVQAQSMTTVALSSVEMAMRIEGVDALGLNRLERHLLRILSNAEPRPISARSLALALGVGVPTVVEVLEPPLVRLEMMSIGSGGRRLTEKGRQHLQAAETREVV